MTTSYFAAAPILSQVVGHNLLAPRAVAARKRALLDFLHHGVTRGEGNLRASKSVATKVSATKAYGAKAR